MKKKEILTDPAACACSTARGLCRRGCDRKESGKSKQKEEEAKNLCHRFRKAF